MHLTDTGYGLVRYTLILLAILGFVSSLLLAILAITMHDEFVVEMQMIWLALPIIIMGLGSVAEMLHHRRKRAGSLLIYAVDALPGMTVSAFFIMVLAR